MLEHWKGFLNAQIELEMQTPVSEMKNTLDRLNSTFSIVKWKINKLKDSIETIQNETK